MSKEYSIGKLQCVICGLYYEVEEMDPFDNEVCIYCDRPEEYDCEVLGHEFEQVDPGVFICKMCGFEERRGI